MHTGNWLYGFVQNYNALQDEDMNTIEEDNNKQNKEEQNVLIVGLDDKNNTEEPTTNEENNNTNIAPKPKPKPVNAPYYIKVNCEANVVTVYKKDSGGKYNTPIKAMLCSVGTATPNSGVYSMSDKYIWRLLEGNVYGQYACRIVGSILFHSVPYVQKDKSTLEWWEYDKLGTKASLGCVRLKVEDAKWIYDNCIPGTKVEFYSSSNVGPLGKPTVQKISNDTEVRNWDPTDPDKDNPWKEYLENKKEQKVPEINNTVKDPQNNNNIVNQNKTNNNNVSNNVTNNITNNVVNSNVNNEVKNSLENQNNLINNKV